MTTHKMHPILILIAVLIALGVCATKVDGECPADTNGDQIVNVQDLLGVLAAWGPCAGCPEDVNGDGVVDVTDLLTVLEGWGPCDPGSPYIAEYANSDCLPDFGEVDQRCGEDEIEFIVEGSTLRVLHRNTLYNCCLDEIRFELTAQGFHLSLLEEEIVTQGCFCNCCFDSSVTVAGLAPGEYTVELCWFDYDTGAVRCCTETVIIS